MILLLLCALSPLDSLYLAGDYAELVRRSAPALAACATREDSATAIRLGAYGLVALGRTDEAAEQFRMLLALAPDTRLDPQTVSPKIRQVFERVRIEVTAQSRQPPTVRVDTVTVRLKPGPTLLIPGLEQVRTGESSKGYALLAAGALSVAGAVFTHASYNDAHHYYLEQTELSKIQQSYRVANNWYKARTICLSSAGLVWLYSLLDATVF